MEDSLWFTTRSALFEPGDAAWSEVVRYEEPLRRLLARRYGRWLHEAERDDLLHEILVERFIPVAEKLAPLFEAMNPRSAPCEGFTPE